MLTLLAAAAALLTQPAAGAGLSACDIYAMKAVAQAEANAQSHCGGQPPRFGLDPKPHRDWCVGAAATLLENENRARLLKIADCQAAWTREADVYCVEYATTAMFQHGMAEGFGCGVSGSRWSADFSAHYAWCMRSKDGRLPEHETGARREAIRQCSGGVVLWPPEPPPFSGDIRVVDWCWEDVTWPYAYTRFNAIVENVGVGRWISRKDGRISVGVTTKGGITHDERRSVPFVELYGIEQGARRIIRGADFGSTIAQVNPQSGVILVHPEDADLAQPLQYIQLTSAGVQDFYAQYGKKRCDFFR